MNRREKKLVAAVVLLIAAALGVAVWMQSRKRYVETVLRDFADLDRQLEKLDPEGSPARRLKEARPQIQNLILDRRYAGAREELDSLRETAHTERVSLIKFDKSLTVNQLLPPDSPERQRAYKLLVALVEKEKAGYDTETVRAELARMGGHALRGEKDQALKSLARAEEALKTVQKIPGFEQLAGAGGELPPAPPGAALASGPGPPLAGPLPGAGLPPAAAQALQSLPPRLQNRLRALAPRLMQAYQQGLDVASLQPLLQELGEAVQKGRPERVGQVLQRLEAALKNLKPRSQMAGAPPFPPKPGEVKQGKAGTPAPPFDFPASPSLFQPPPASSAGKGGGKMPVGDLTPTVLAALDRIRAMPAEEYKQQRPFIARMIAQLFQGMAGPAVGIPQPSEGGGGGGKSGNGGARPGEGPAAPSPRSVPDRQRPTQLPERKTLQTATGLNLELSATGRVTAVRIGNGRPEGVALPLREDALSGFCLERAQGEPLPLGGIVEFRGQQATQRVDDPTAQVQLRAVYTPDKDGLSIRARLTSLAPGPRTLRLSFRLPLDVVGWHWTKPSGKAGQGEAEEIMAGQVYRVQPNGNLLLRSVLAGKTGTLYLETKGESAEVVYDAVARVWSVIFSWSPQPRESQPRPATEIAFRLNAMVPSPEPAAPGFPAFPPAEK